MGKMKKGMFGRPPASSAPSTRKTFPALEGAKESFKSRDTNVNLGEKFGRSVTYLKAVQKRKFGVITFSVVRVAPDKEGRVPFIYAGGEGKWVVRKARLENGRCKNFGEELHLFGTLPSGCPSFVYTGYAEVVGPERQLKNYMGRCSEQTRFLIRKGKKKVQFKGYHRLKTLTSLHPSLPSPQQMPTCLHNEMWKDESAIRRDMKGYFGIPESERPPLQEWYRKQPWWKEYERDGHFPSFEVVLQLLLSVQEHEKESRNHLHILKQGFSWFKRLATYLKEDPWAIVRSETVSKFYFPECFKPSTSEATAERLIRLEEKYGRKLNAKEEKARKLSERAHRVVAELHKKRANGHVALSIPKGADPEVLRFLREKLTIIDAVGYPEHVVLRDDWDDMGRLIGALETKKYKFDTAAAGARDLEERQAPRRGGPIPAPCLPSSELCSEQQHVVEHVARNWLTIVCGTPGSGKTECIAYLHMRYCNVLVLSKCNTMVAELNKRIGGGGITVDSAVFRFNELTGKNSEEEVRKFYNYQVLVIDECSNLSTKDFSRAIELCPNATRLVLVGDRNQIPSIEQGDPFQQLIDAYPQCVHSLRENHRVEKHAKKLVEVYESVLEGDLEDVCNLATFFGEEEEGGGKKKLEDETFVFANYEKATGSYHDLVPIILEDPTFRGREDWQALAVNKETVAFFNMMEFKKRYPLSAKKAEARYREEKPILVCEGMRVCFKKNQPGGLVHFDGQEKLGVESDEVCNGELAIVESVRDYETNLGDKKCKVKSTALPGCLAANGAGHGKLRVLHLRGGKKVVLDHRKGLSPYHVTYGWAATVDSMQGAEERTVLFVHPGQELRGKKWNMSHLYVAASRARRRLWILGDTHDIGNMLNSAPVKRDSDLANRIKKKRNLSRYSPRKLDMDVHDYRSVELYTSLASSERKGPTLAQKLRLGEEEQRSRELVESYQEVSSDDGETLEFYQQALESERKGKKKEKKEKKEKKKEPDSDSDVEMDMESLFSGYGDIALSPDSGDEGSRLDKLHGAVLRILENNYGNDIHGSRTKEADKREVRESQICKSEHFQTMRRTLKRYRDIKELEKKLSNLSKKRSMEPRSPPRGKRSRKLPPTPSQGVVETVPPTPSQGVAETVVLERGIGLQIQTNRAESRRIVKDGGDLIVVHSGIGVQKAPPGKSIINFF